MSEFKDMFRGFHHYYLGLLLLLIGFFLLWLLSTWIALIISLVGGYICGDDFYQHARQRSDIVYRSPLHRLYGYLYMKFSFIRRLNKLIDRVFGRGV